MKVVALIGQKGGSGKTTLAENLSVEGTARHKVVVLIDLDSQPSATGWGDRRKKETPVVISAQVARVRKVIETAKDMGADLVIIDTPPRMAEATIEAARVSDLVLIPVRPLINDVETIPALTKVLEVAGKPKTILVINAAPVQGQRDVEARKVAEGYGLAVCPVVIHQRSAIGDAPVDGLAVRELEATGKAAGEISQLYLYINKLINI